MVRSGLRYTQQLEAGQAPRSPARALPVRKNVTLCTLLACTDISYRDAILYLE